MNPFASIAMLGGAVAFLAAAWRRMQISNAVSRRLADGEAVDDEEKLAFDDRPFARRHRALPIICGAGLAAIAHFGLAVSALFATTFGVMTALVASQLESFVFARRNARMELQLADAIDLIVGALAGGGGAVAALDAAARQTPKPLQPILQDVLGRLRYGNDPRIVFQQLADRVPLETYLLFSTTLAVHFEIGGQLAPTLSTVGKTVRDRIELSRKLRGNGAQAQFSMAVILCVTYFIAVVTWRMNPEQMESFTEATIARFLIASSMIMQSFGIVWMSAMSRPKF